MTDIRPALREETQPVARARTLLIMSVPDCHAQNVAETMRKKGRCAAVRGSTGCSRAYAARDSPQPLPFGDECFSETLV